MILARLKGIYCVDVADLAKFMPERPDVFCICLTALVGPHGKRGEDSFHVNVCTPGWMAEMCEKDGFVLGSHYLVVNAYNWSQILAILTKLLQNCSGETWEEVARKVGRIGTWEFEDYRNEASP